MARVLAYTSPARGHLYPLTSILSELQRRGHDVVVRTLASELPLMRSQGFTADAIDARVEAVPLEDWRGRNPQRALKIAVGGFVARAEHDADDLRRAIDAVQPDAVLVDVNSWGALAAAEKWGGPWAMFCPYPLALRSRDVPPFGPGLRPARGVAGRLRDTLLRPVVMGALQRIMLAPLNDVRHDLGLGPLAGSDDVFLRPPLTLYLTAEPFEYPRSNWPSSVVMVGPCSWEPPADPPSWLDEIDQPIVLVTTSSEFQDDGRLIATAFEALAGEPFYVVATVPAGDPGEYNPPPNGRVDRFLPHGPLLDRAVCAVTHGGMGATQKALLRGVPVCAVPFGRDQLEVARRVEVANAGTRLAAKKLRGDRLLAQINRARDCRDGARRVAAGYAAAGGPSAAAAAIETRLLDLRPAANET